MIAQVTRGVWPVARTFAIFLAIALASLLFTKLQGRVAAVWPANAFLLVTLLRTRASLRPALAVAAFLANVTADVATSDELPRALFLSAANLVEVGVAFAGLQRVLRSSDDLVRPRQLGLFIIVALLAPAAGALASAYVLSDTPGFSVSVLRTWWTADALGLLIFAPAAFILLDGSSRDLLRRRHAPTTLVSLSTLLVAVSATFLQTDYPFLFLVPPCLVLMTFLSGLAGSAWGILIVAVFGIAATVNGLGPATLARGQHPLEVLQIFLAFLVLTTLPLASVLDTRRKLERALVDERDRANATANALATGRAVSGMAQETAGVGYWIYRPQGRTTTWSPQMYRLYGFPDDGQLPDFQAVLSRFHPDDRPRAAEYALRSLETGEEYSLELRITADGLDRTVLARTRPAVLPDGERALLGVMVDVTAVRRIEAELAASEARYRRLAENSTDIIAMFGVDARFTYLSPSIETILGYRPEELIGQPTRKVMHPDDFKESLRIYGEHLASDRAREPFFFQYRAIRKDGETAWLECHPCAIFDEATGEVTGFQDVIRDVTDQKAAEAALEASETRYRELAETIPDLIMRLRGPEITYVSAACRRYGYEPEDLVGRPITDFVHPDDVAGSLERNRAHMSGDTGGDLRREQRVRTADGLWVWLEGNPRPVRGLEGQVVEVINVFRDVSRRRALEDELIAARAAAEHAAHVKTDFMSNMSHELRTPLTAIIGFSGLLKATGGLESRNAMLVERVEKAGKALLGLVNQVLDFSKIESGEIQFEAVMVNSGELVAEALGFVTPQAQAKGIALNSDIGNNAHDFTGDPARIRQVLVNLLSNAVKFTDEGAVSVAVSRDGRGFVRFEVADTGPGIPADRLDAIFDRYTQVDGSTTRTHGGTGLGLAICRGLVEAMGGEIGVESEQGAGSTFWFVVPSRPATANSMFTAA